ncbi:MAG TPA: TonB-dependent receptor [Terriglobia bacterium]|nr:TonB-dependent receptor [Terriglobia bacterium]
MKACLAVFFLGALAAYGDSNAGELRLKVTDPAGLGVASAVELVSEANQFRETYTTDGEGKLDAERLPFGVYQVRVQRAGFAPYAGSLEIRSVIPAEYRVRLALASTTTSVVVSAQPTLLDPHRVGDVNRIGAQTIESRETSLPGRAVIDLVNAQPGWLYEGTAVLHPRGSEYQTQFVVDGVPLTDNRSPGFGPDIEADDVDSVSVYTAGFPAEYGRKMGGVVDIVTAKDARPGWHGKAVATGGSFGTADGYASAQYGWGRNTLGFSGDGAGTSWYENPVVPQNYTNRGSTSDFAAHFERDLTDRDRAGLIVRHEQSIFEVPNEQMQELAGQRQDRTNEEVLAIGSYQHTFSPNVLGDFHAMFRQDTDRFWSNPLSTPITAFQNRGFKEGYVKGAIAVHHGIQEWKAGLEADFMPLRETFSDTITDFAPFDEGTPGTFAFQGKGHDFEQAAFVQDNVRLGAWSLNAGLRWDHYQLLVNQTAVSPRLGTARYWAAADMVLHFSYDRIFETPAFENILLSSSPQVVSLNPDFLRLPVQPSRGNYYEAGLTKGFFNKLKLDANYFRRSVTNFADDDLLLNTSISFPIAFRKAAIYGGEARLDLPGWGRLSGSASYSYEVGSAYLPATGGLFLGNEDINSNTQGLGRFWNSQDQRHTLRTRYRWQISKRAWVGLGAEYGSGLPVEFEGTREDAIAQYGQRVVERVDLEDGRVRPQFSLDASAGVELYKTDRMTVHLQGDIENLNNRLNLIDFAGLFSGNAIGPPRSGFLRLQADF